MPTDDSELSRRLFNDPSETAGPERGDISYDAAVLEQYKLYVEMADRISARRGLTNTFFLTLNTTVVGLVAAVGTFPPAVQRRGWPFRSSPYSASVSPGSILSAATGS